MGCPVDTLYFFVFTIQINCFYLLEQIFCRHVVFYFLALLSLYRQRAPLTLEQYVNCKYGSACDSRLEGCVFDSGSISAFPRVWEHLNQEITIGRVKQLNATFVAPKLQLQNRTCKPLCDFGAILAIYRRGMRYNSRNTVTLSSSFTF